jgi:putative membrane protein
VDPAVAVIDLTQPQRQSPLAIVFLGLRAIRSLGVVQFAVLALFFIRGAADGRLLLVGVVAVAGLAAMSVLSWWRYTFQFADGELVVTRGVVRIDRLTVDAGRIQSIAIEQELLHRLTDLVKVVVDTAGSSQTEFTIDAIARPVAEELQQQATAVAAIGPDAASVEPGLPPGRIVFQHSPRRLAVAALTMSPWAGLALLVPLLALDDVVLRPITDQLQAWAPDADVERLGWWVVPMVGVAAAVFVSVLNLGRVFLADWNLALRSDATTLCRTSGLLSRTSTTTSVARLQVLSSRRNPLQRRAGLHDLQLSNAGQGDMRLIGCRDSEFAAAAAIAGLSAVGSLPLDRRVHPAEIWLSTRNTAVIAAVVAGAASLVVGWWALLALAAIVPAWWAARRNVRTFRWSLGPEIATSRRVITSSTQQAVVRKTNVVRVSQSIFERRRGLGRVEVVTAAGKITIGMIPIAEAYAVRDVIVHGVETDHRAWM